jgi:hypothetical protein
VVTIANPIYDTVFKHLLEDQEVARGLLSSLLQVEILEIEPRPQEVTDVKVTPPLEAQDSVLRVFRMDFTARVRLATQETKTVILELQKAGKAEALVRFRNYLGRTYQSRERDEEGRPLPVLAVYILGFNAHPGRPALVLVNSHMTDGVSKEPLPAPDNPADDAFFHALTHDAAFVQIPRIKDLKGNGEVEQALRLFDQSFINKDRHFLVIGEAMAQKGPAWLLKAFRVLQSAAADEDVRQAMAVEDEISEAFENIAHQLEEERRQKEEERRQKEEERKQKEEERKQKEEERRQKEEERRQKEEALAKAEAAIAEAAAMRHELELLRKKHSS